MPSIADIPLIMQKSERKLFIVFFVPLCVTQA